MFFAILALVSAQNFGRFFSGQYSLGAGFSDNLQAARDPRANTGPVLFPQAPPDNGETSGVVVGASGYGFVPPNTQSMPKV